MYNLLTFLLYSYLFFFAVVEQREIIEQILSMKVDAVEIEPDGAFARTQNDGPILNGIISEHIKFAYDISPNLSCAEISSFPLYCVTLCYYHSFYLLLDCEDTGGIDLINEIDSDFGEMSDFYDDPPDQPLLVLWPPVQRQYRHN